jgi:hypothetical protein
MGVPPSEHHIGDEAIVAVAVPLDPRVQPSLADQFSEPVILLSLIQMVRKVI